MDALEQPQQRSPSPACFVCPLTSYLEGRVHLSLFGLRWNIVFSQMTLLHLFTLCVFEGIYVTACTAGRGQPEGARSPLTMWVPGN